MKLTNPILITLNNVPHIKADNLEAVEVDSSCDSELKQLIGKAYLKAGGWLRCGLTLEEFKKDGVKIPKRMADRIFISRKWKPLTNFCNDCGSGTHKNECDNADSGCIHFTSKAFLLPAKEDNEVSFGKYTIADVGETIEWEYSGNKYQAKVSAINREEYHYCVYVPYLGGQDLIPFDNATIVIEKSYTIEEIEMANRIIIQDLHEKNTELTKEVEILEEWKKKYEDNQVEIFERVKNQEHKIVDLTKEVERLREEREHSINKLNNLINDCQERADNFLELGMDASEKTSLAMKHAYLEAKNIIKFHPPINQ